MYIGRKRPREESPEYALDHFPDINCVMHTTIRSQKRGETEQTVREVLADIVLKAAANADLCYVKEVLKWDHSLPLYTMVAKGQVASTYDVTDRIVGNLSTDEQQFFLKNITCTEVERIAAETITQGNCSRWYKERSVRISSSVAHRVITRKRSFESLAEQLQKSKSPRVPAILYGTAMEQEAREDFEVKVGTKVTKVGLVISPLQPWLCASPDGLFEANDGVTLLEIKCPYSRKDDYIIDAELQQSYVNYIVYDNGSLKLACSHQYYCQVQVAMYVTNTEQCFFFVYSRKQSVTIVVERDEAFLSENIPKLEHFFYSFYIKQLMK